MKHTLESLFGVAGISTPKIQTGGGHRNAEEPTLAEVKKLLADIEDFYYRSPLTCAKRLAVGTRIKNPPKHILDVLDDRELEALGRFSSTHGPLVHFMVKQRSEDLICSKPMYLTYDQLVELAKRADILAGRS